MENKGMENNKALPLENKRMENKNGKQDTVFIYK